MLDCLFCQFAQPNPPGKVLWSDDWVIVLQDINPQAPVHQLIIPRRHITSLNEVTEADAQLIGHLFTIARRQAEQARCDQAGYRTVFNCNQAGGQAIFHLHLHLLGGRQLKWPPG